MSFGENVVYYRKELKITQEELAEKLCVSRQTVSRWENDSFFPDMDTLIKLCDLFECDMDTLVRGQAEKKTSLNSNNDDNFTINEYDKHMNKFSLFISFGVALIILGVSLLLLINAFISELVGIIVLLSLITVSVTLFIIGGISHDGFMREHPNIEPYPDGANRGFMKKFPFYIASATILIFIGVISIIIMNFNEGYAPAGFSVEAWELFSVSLFLFLISIAVFLYVYSGMQHSKYNIKEYNEECIKEGYNTEHISEEVRKSIKLEDTISGIIMMVATISFLLMGFLGNLWHPAWVVFPVGGILCGIASIIIKQIFNK